MTSEDIFSNLIGQQLRDHLGPEYEMDWEWGSIFFHNIGVLNIFENTDLIMKLRGIAAYHIHLRTYHTYDSIRGWRG